MTKIVLKERTTEFINYDLFGKEDSFCKVIIKVEDVEYENKKQYYYISYSYQYNLDDDKRSHPFWGNKHLFDEHSDGEIIYKNKMSTEMINHLLMDDTTLSEICGCGTPQSYKANIMKCLAYLWD